MTADKEKTLTLLKTLTVLKLPVFWVLFCISAASILFTMGVGNPRLEKFVEEDAKLEWYKQRPGKIFMAQASREKQRAAALRYLDQVSDAEKWSLMAAEAFRKSAEYWKNTPVYLDLKIAEAVMLADAGKALDGFNILMEQEVVPGNRVYVSYNYYFGLVADKAGKKDDAESLLRKALSGTDSLQEQILDKMLDSFAKDRREAGIISCVSLICGTAVSSEEIKKECKRKLGIRKDKKKSSRHKVKGEKDGHSGSSEDGNKTDFEIEILE